MSVFKDETSKFLLKQTSIENLLALIEPTYQQVQKEAKKRIKSSKVVIPKTIQDRHALCKPIDYCYIGFEQIIEKLQADIKVLKNLCFGDQKFFNFLFTNLDPNEPRSVNDKHVISQHYMNSMLRWFFLDVSNLLESTIRDFCVTNNIKPVSNRDSLFEKIKPAIPQAQYETLKKIITANLDNHTNFPRFLDQLNITKNGSEFRNFTDMLLKIRNASHNGFYYGINLKSKVMTAFDRTQSFMPGEIIDVNIYDVAYFLINSINLIKALESEVISKAEKVL